MPSSHRPRDKGSAKYPHGILRPAVAEMETPKSRYRVATLYPVSISSRFSPSPPVRVTLYLPYSSPCTRTTPDHVQPSPSPTPVTLYLPYGRGT